MFTGIIETLGTITNLEKDNTNLILTIESDLSRELKIDQSVSHNGVCLTVVEVDSNYYKVQAINETLEKTNLGALEVGDSINLERAMKLGARLDGHLVQGHVDCTATCISVNNQNGSWIYTFSYDYTEERITIEKGSITINGVSLTVINSQKNSFRVAIIPYTYEHTNFKYLKENSKVNLEFDVIGKYVAKLASR